MDLRHTTSDNAFEITEIILLLIRSEKSIQRKAIHNLIFPQNK